MNLLDIFENREPYQQAIDRLEQRRIQDLEAKMDDLMARSKEATSPEHKAGLKREFDKAKAERDSYYKINEDQGGVTPRQGSFTQLPTEEGLVLLGAGGDPMEWINGVANMWAEQGIAKSGNPADLFSDAILLKTTGGRTDLVLPFKSGAPIDMGKLAMWRLSFGDASWISDFKDNYASQYGVENTLEENTSNKKVAGIRPAGSDEPWHFATDMNLSGWSARAAAQRGHGVPFEVGIGTRDNMKVWKVFPHSDHAGAVAHKLQDKFDGQEKYAAQQGMAEGGIPGNVPVEKIPGKEDLLKGQGRKYYEEDTLTELNTASDKNYTPVGNYGLFDLYVSKKKFNNLAFIAVAEPHRPKDKGFRATGVTPEEAVQNLKDQIDPVMAQISASGKQVSNAGASLDFNIDFKRQVLEMSDLPFYSKVIPGPKLVIAGREMENYPEELRKQGFKRSYPRRHDGSQLPGADLPAAAAVSAGIIANGRYVLNNEVIDDNGNRIFNMELHSVTQASNDQLRLGIPGVTIGTERDKKNSSSAVKEHGGGIGPKQHWQDVAEVESHGEVEAHGYLHNINDQKIFFTHVFPNEQTARLWARKSNATIQQLMPVNQGVKENDSRDAVGNKVDKDTIRKMAELRKRIADAERRDKESTKPVGEDIYMEDSGDVEGAIIRRIMVAHTDLLQKFGPQKVMQAAEEVAYDVGDVDEIGTSDVSIWVRQVMQILGA